MRMKNTIVSNLVDFDINLKWFLKKLPELRKKYPGKVILIKEKKVKVVGRSIEEVVRKAKGMGLDPSRELIRYIPKEEITVII